MADHFRWQGEDLLLYCHFQPKAAADEIVGLHGHRIKIRITAPPVEGKANEHILILFSRWFGVPKSRVRILQGELGRQKTLCICKPEKIPAGINLD